MASYETVSRQIGEWGRYQLRIMIMIVLVSMPIGIQTILTVFTMAEPKFRCAVSNLPNETYHIRGTSADEPNHNVSLDVLSMEPSQCSRYTNTADASRNQSGNSRVNATKENCAAWVYDRDVFSSTLVTELNLVCDNQIIISHVNMMNMAGLLVGSIVSGFPIDFFGRKPCLIVFLVLQVLTSIASAFLYSIPLLLTLRFAISAFGISYFAAAYVLLMEVIGPSIRGTAGIVIMFGWAGGVLVVSLLSFLIRDWKNLQIALSAPCLVFISYWWLLPESPRWLVCKGRLKEAHAILVKMAKVNQVELPEKMLLTDSPLDQEPLQIQESEPKKSAWTLFKSPALVLRMVIILFNWLMNSMAFYGFTLNIGSIIEGSIHLNFFIQTLVELASYAVMLVVINRIGRKTLYLSCVFLCAAACLGTVVPLLLNTNAAWIISTLSNIGKFGISASFAIVWLYTSEMLPTSIRNTGLGFSSFAARVGGMISPYVGRLHNIVGGPFGKALPLVVFGAIALAAGVLALLLPETKDQILPETIEDAQKLSRNSKDDKSSTTGCDETPNS